MRKEAIPVKLECKRKSCGHRWYPRIVDVKQCPKCRSVRWYQPKEKTKEKAIER